MISNSPRQCVKLANSFKLMKKAQCTFNAITSNLPHTTTLLGPTGSHVPGAVNKFGATTSGHLYKEVSSPKVQ